MKPTLPMSCHVLETSLWKERFTHLKYSSKNEVVGSLFERGAEGIDTLRSVIFKVRFAASRGKSPVPRSWGGPTGAGTSRAAAPFRASSLHRVSQQPTCAGSASFAKRLQGTDSRKIFMVASFPPTWKPSGAAELWGVADAVALCVTSKRAWVSLGFPGWGLRSVLSCQLHGYIIYFFFFPAVVCGRFT